VTETEQTKKQDGWKRTTLGNALPIRYGKARSEKHGLVREATPVYGSSGVIDTFTRALTNGPTLIVGRKGTVGATYYSPEPCWPIDTVYFTEAEADKDLRFFKYLLDHLQLGKMDRSTAVPGLSRDDYNAKEVYIPEVDEQREIVAEIEKQFTRLEAGVAALRSVQMKLKRYRAAVLKAACEGKLVPTEAELARQEGRSYETGAELLERILTERRQKWSGKGKYKDSGSADTTNLQPPSESWAWSRLEQLGMIFGGLTKNPKRDKLPRQLPYLRVANVYANELRLEEIEDIGVDDSELEKLLLHRNDLLVVEGNGSKDQIGRLAIWDGSIDPCVHQNHLIKVRPVLSQLAKWILYWLLSPIGRQFVEIVASSTSGLYTLSVNKVGELCIALPPLAEQERIVAEVERRLSVVDELEAVVNANLQRSTRLRQSILQRAFTGCL
jgi:type I restriction enzyme S subunit